MNLSLKIARRYLFSKKSTNAINLISMISVLGMAIGTTAFFVLLSVFNGFESLVISLYNSFYPEIHISAVEGKTFIPNDDAIMILSPEQVEEYTFTRVYPVPDLVIVPGLAFDEFGNRRGSG
ncbi:MAG: ABC transporter permease, partial [Bacteroidetes bacterium]|nr:ABC transporter permease [Bacteroidota bacterium]